MAGIVCDDLDRIMAGNTLISEIWAGNVLVYQYDSTAPALTVTAPAGTASGSPTYYTSGTTYRAQGTVSDAESGVSAVYVNGSAAVLSGNTWYKDITVAANTTVTVQVYAVDKAGNRSATITRYVRYDSAAPSLAVTTPANNAVVTSANVTVSGTASDASGLRSLTVNGVAVSVAANGTWSRTITLGGTGANTITVIVTDNAGRTTTVTRTVVYMFKDSDIVIPVYVKGVAKDGYNTSNSWSTGIVQIPESHTVYYITGSQYVYIHVTFFSAVICKVVMNEGQMTPSGTLGGVPHPVIGQITGTGWWRFKIPAANGYARLGIYVFTNPLLSINNDSYIQPWVGSANLGVRFSPFTVSGNNYSGGQITIDKIVTVSY